MRRSAWIPVTLALTALVSAAPAAAAQYGARNRGLDHVEDIIAEPPRPAPGVAALALEHAAELELSAEQKAALESLRRTQDSANAPWLQRLDSLRPTRRPVNPSDLSPEQREEIAARRAAIELAMNGMRETNTSARERALAVLTPEQQRRAAELEKQANKRADEERRRRAREGAERSWGVYGRSQGG